MCSCSALVLTIIVKGENEPPTMPEKKYALLNERMPPYNVVWVMGTRAPLQHQCGAQEFFNMTKDNPHSNKISTFEKSASPLEYRADSAEISL